MAKDLMGNTVKVGDKMFFNGTVYEVKDIRENRIFGGRMVEKTKGIALKVPDEIVLECTLTGDFEKPLQGFVIKTPPETGAAEA